MQDVLH